MSECPENGCIRTTPCTVYGLCPLRAEEEQMRESKRIQPKMAAATAEKYSKPSVMRGSFLRFPLAMAALTELGRIGCIKHQVPEGDQGFLDLPDAKNIFLDALGRHLLAWSQDGDVYAETINPDTISQQKVTLRHTASIAWNAMALLECTLMDEKEEQERSCPAYNPDDECPF